MILSSDEQISVIRLQRVMTGVSTSLAVPQVEAVGLV
jgi:hypothetical protein